MKLQSIETLLAGNPYPGRGILLGLTPDARHAAIAYFIMGRSVNSRNRVFTAKDGGIITEAFDPALLADPSLIIYAPVRVRGNATIVTNGDQTDTVYDFLARGRSFEDALRTRTFEPDAPNFTPRISGLVQVENGALSYRLAILKANDGDPESPQRFFFDYPAPAAGEARFLHTYRTDGDPIPSFEGEPERVQIPNDLPAFTDALWQWLDADNMVSLFTRFIDLQTGATSDRIINKNQ